MVEYILHGPAVGKGALAYLSLRLLRRLLPVSALALVRVQQQHQLLPDQLPLLFFFEQELLQ